MNPRIVLRAAAYLLQGALLALPAMARPDMPETPMVLVATPAGTAAFGEAVILAVPTRNGGHFGFVLNAPTDTPLASLLPEDEASRRVSARVHFGGPLLANGLFALVREPIAAPAGLRRITPELSVALDSDEIDRVIAQRPADARFFLGLVAWGAGELAAEVKAGAWQVEAPDASVVMSSNPSALWSRLAARARGQSAKLDRPPRGIARSG